jgi:hypothetical protein
MPAKAMPPSQDLGHIAFDKDRRSPHEPLRPYQVPKTVRLGDYPQLVSIAWHLIDENTKLTAEEAFALYERNWRHVELDQLGPEEQALIDGLTFTIGKGVLLV